MLYLLGSPVDQRVIITQPVLLIRGILTLYVPTLVIWVVLNLLSYWAVFITSRFKKIFYGVLLPIKKFIMYGLYTWLVLLLIVAMLGISSTLLEINWILGTTTILSVLGLLVVSVNKIVGWLTTPINGVTSYFYRRIS